MRTLLLPTLLLATALAPTAAADTTLVEICADTDLAPANPCVRSTYVDSAGAACAGLLEGQTSHVFVACAGELDCPVYVDPVWLTGGYGFCAPGLPHTY